MICMFKAILKLLLAGVFENFRNIYLEIYELNLAHFFTYFT